MKIVVALGLSLGLGFGAVGCAFDASGFGEPTSSEGNRPPPTPGIPLDSSGGPPPTGVASTSTSGTGPTITGDASDATMVGDSSTALDGSSGLSPSPLTNRGLLARWYIDEAHVGQEPTVLHDANAPAVDLAMVYTGGSPSFGELDASRGLRWNALPGSGGSAQAMVGDTKLAQLHGSTQATFELVLAVDAVFSDTSRFVHIGLDTADGDLSLGSASRDQLALRWYGYTIRRFGADLDGQRQVIHLTIDTEEDDVEDRFVAYLDGERLTAEFIQDLPAQGAPISLQESARLSLGNRGDGTRSFRGWLSYAAIYTVALTPRELMDHATVLSVSDDP